METGHKSYPVFDCDSHIVEPKAIWDEYVPKGKREYVKSHFYNPLIEDIKVLNGKAYPYNKYSSITSTSSWVPGRSSEENRKRIGHYLPGTPEYDEHVGMVAATWDPHARLKDMDVMGIDQVMIFPSHMVYLPLVREAGASSILVTAYNDWAYDYCQADPTRIFPCGLLALQDVDGAVAEIRRLAKKGFKVVAIRPVLWSGRYPTFPEFDPVWRELEESGMVLGMHTFPSSEPMNADIARRMRPDLDDPEGGLWKEIGSYSPGQMVQNVVDAMGVPVSATSNIGFMVEAETWLTIVLMTGWLNKFPKMKAAILESNATWLPVVLEKAETYLKFGFLRGVDIPDPVETFYNQCSIAFESDEEPVFRMYDHFENVGLWSSDYPHLDGADAWEAIELMKKWNVPEHVQAKLMGENARRLYGIEPVLKVTEHITDFVPTLEPTVGRI
jgi:predicted TIM-barrel fold metal-dependent hydrolase